MGAEPAAQTQSQKAEAFDDGKYDKIRHIVLLYLSKEYWAVH